MSNTTFIFPSNVADFQVRYFTPTNEINVCGHSTIATIFAWGRENIGHNRAEKIITVNIETAIGILPIEVELRDGIVFAVTVALANPHFRNATIERGEVLRALNIVDDLTVSRYPLEIVYDGLAFLEVGVKDLSTLLQISPSFAEISKISKLLEIDSIQVFTLQPALSTSTVHSRTFFPAVGVNEDPVCGTGNGALASYLVKNRLVLITRPTTTIIGEQGVSVSRPGIVTALVDLEGDTITKLRIKGKAILSLDGKIFISE
jgi:trans-2,3-dihydro-3-hydroxyanthranilate isomerase